VCSRTVIRAEGEGEAAATILNALSKAGKAFVIFSRIEASKAIVQALAAKREETSNPSGGNGNGELLNVLTSQQCNLQPEGRKCGNRFCAENTELGRQDVHVRVLSQD
jgi:hypothetical protein